MSVTPVSVGSVKQVIKMRVLPSRVEVNSYRKRQTRLWKRLQAKKTSSARRLLKRRRRK